MWSAPPSHCSLALTFHPALLHPWFSKHIWLHSPPPPQGGFPDSSVGKESASKQETLVQLLGQENPLEKG